MYMFILCMCTFKVKVLAYECVNYGLCDTYLLTVDQIKPGPVQRLTCSLDMIQTWQHVLFCVYRVQIVEINR